MLTLRRRRILAIVALIGLVIWLGSSAFVAWKLTRRSRAPLPNPYRMSLGPRWKGFG